MLDNKTKERIEKAGVDYFTGPYTRVSVYNRSNKIVNAYIAGAEAEAERVQGLAKALKGMVDYWKWSIGDPNFKEYKAAVEALTNYNNPK